MEQKCNPVPAGQTACLCALLSKACPVSRMALPPKCHVGLQLSDSPAGQSWVFSHYPGLCAFLRRGRRPVVSVPRSGYAWHSPVPRAPCPGQCGQEEPRGHSRAVLAQGPFGCPRPVPAAVCARDSPRSLRRANKEERQG